MANYILCLIIQRMLLPAVICGCIAIRPVGISLLQLLFLLLLPYIPIANKKSLKGGTSTYFLCFIYSSLLTFLVQVSLQIAWFMKASSSWLNDKKFNDVMSIIGFVNVNELSIIRSCRWMFPELLAFITVSVLYSCLQKLSRSRKNEIDVLKSVLVHSSKEFNEEVKVKPKQHLSTAKIQRLLTLGQLTSVGFLCIAGSVQPSLPNGVYFLSFVAFSTWLACNRKLSRKFAFALKGISVVLMLHINILVLYQSKWLQDILWEEDFLTRSFCLSKIYTTSGRKKNILRFNEDLNWDQYLNPLVLIVTYFMITITSNFILTSDIEIGRFSQRKGPAGSANVKSKFALMARKLVEMQNRHEKLSEENIVREKKYKIYLKFIIKNAGIMLYRSNYLITNVIMMIWSIVYHSWFGLVLLIWSNLVWIISNQRNNLLKTSPLLVTYAIILLLITYIYGLKLNDDELPKNLHGVNLQQIGFVKYSNYPIMHLLMKSLFTVAFCMTLRQMLIEREIQNRKLRIKLTDTAREILAKHQFEMESEIIKTAVNVMRKTCIFGWMWMIVLVLLVMSLTGKDQITFFQIVDMSFFLVFVLMFQLSLKLWLRALKIFWLTLILYSMMALLLVYIYQFDDFPTDLISWQREIGLNKYETKKLFEKLLSFTSIIILSGLQLHYFQQSFMDYFSTKQQNSNEENEYNFQDSSDGIMMTKQQIFKKYLMEFFEKTLILIDLHRHKVLFLVSFAAAVFQLHMLSIGIMILLTIGIQLNSDVFKTIIIKIVSAMLMAYIFCLMFYQLKFPELRQNQSNNCMIDFTSVDSIREMITTNIIHWYNIDSQKSIMELIWSYLVFIMIVSIFSIVQRRQKMQRKLKRNSAKCPSVVFEGVSRADADKSLINLMKFVANYGFYKFGIEISLITFIIVIFVRLDVIASLYVIWFTALVLWNRDQLEKFWIIATHFIAISIIIQSLILAAQIAFNSCSQFSSILQLGTLQYLYHYPSLLFYDFVLLTLMTCQVNAFKSSRANGPNNFNQFGGSNQSIFLDSIYIENIENPLYAFNDKIECFIDLLKHYIFKIQFWVTLSIIFLAGTQQVNLSTFGYIAASFIFFWQGSDFYLKPLKIIVRWWNILLFYNIFIIFGKVVINVIGCNFNQVLSNHYCWVAEWFNVSCAEESTCFSLSRDNSYFWDTIAFAVLILQRRIFMSFYFCNVKNETFITTILASRGAELIEELRMNEMNREIAEEAETLSNLKLKMEKIKSFELAHKSDSNDPLSHIDAIHDGGYYMFDYDEPNAEEVELEQEQEQQLKPTQTVDKIVRFFSTYIDKAKAPKNNQLEETSNTSVHSKLWSTIKIIFSTWLLNVVQRMHCVGRRHYGFIIKMLAQEKKTLKNRMTPGMNNNKFDILNLREINLSFITKEMHDHEPLTEVNITEVLQEMLYLIITHSDLIVYLMICINQIESASVISLPLSFLVYFWATLTFPRPSKAFWILLIAYTQTIILIKCLSQFKMLWWDKNHPFIKLLGIDQRHGFATYDLTVLMLIFLHRAVLKKFGLWKSSVAEEFTEGCFLLDKCDDKTSQLIEYNLIQSLTSMKSESDDDAKIYRFGSREHLIDDMHLNCKVIFRHEINDNVEIPKVRSVYKHRYELLTADEELFKDNNGKMMIKLLQDNIRLRLRPIHCDNISQTYPVDKLIIADCTLEEPSDFCSSSIIMMSIKRYISFMKKYFRNMIPEHKFPRKIADVYKYMFLCDFINFLILLFGFTEFAIQTDEDRTILHYFEENKIPTALLFLLVFQFAMIIIDRVLYLCKNITIKVIFHFFTILSTHVWMFFILPAVTGRRFNATAPPVMYYIIKCFYLLLSAYQIRCGYPARVLGNFLMKNHNIMNLVGFKAFMTLPFLFELRTLIDWMCTSTSLSLSEWLKVETIHVQVFTIKCFRNLGASEQRGNRKSKFVKFFVGGGLTLLLVAVLWFPLAVFAYSGALGQSNIPNDGTISLQIGTFESIYNTNAHKNNIHTFQNSDFNNLKSIYEKYAPARLFIEDFEAEDVAAIRLSTESSSQWSISPPLHRKMIEQLRNNVPMICRLSYSMSHKTQSKSVPEKLSGSIDYELNDEKIRKKLMEALENTDENRTDAVTIPFIFPKFISIKKNEELEIIPQLLLSSENILQPALYRNLTLRMHIVNGLKWWDIKESCDDAIYKKFLQHLPYENCNKFLTMFVFSEKKFPSSLSSLAVKGVIGLYVTVILFFSRFIRSKIFTNDIVTIIVEELPNVDRILNLCRDIYLVREAKQFRLEEDLVAKLLFLYRSPETLIKWTKLKK